MFDKNMKSNVIFGGKICADDLRIFDDFQLYFSVNLLYLVSPIS